MIKSVIVNLDGTSKILEVDEELPQLDKQPTVEEKMQAQIDDLNLIMAEVIGGGL